MDVVVRSEATENADGPTSHFDPSTKDPSIVQAIVGATVFGAVIPLGSWLLSFWVEWPVGPYWALGVAFAAYTFHAIALRRQRFGRLQSFCVVVTILVGLAYGAWIESAQSLVEIATNRFETPPPPGVPGGYGVGMTVTPMVTGSVMALLLLVATRSVAVSVTTLIASIVCGLLVLPTWGGSSILWNLAVAVSLYRWAWRFPRAPLCQACGYDLAGNLSGVCPECGRILVHRSSAQNSDDSKKEAQ